MVQIIHIAIAVTSIIALMSSIYQLGVQNGKIQAYEEIETNLEKMRQRIKESYYPKGKKLFCSAKRIYISIGSKMTRHFLPTFLSFQK